MQRLYKNHGGYHGEKIDLASVLRAVEATAGERGWSVEVFFAGKNHRLTALHRPAKLSSGKTVRRIYISAGIHGDEPAGPLAALRLLEENIWPTDAEIFLLPCLNPAGFASNRRENADGVDLNRDYRRPQTAEVRAHIAWLERQNYIDLCFCLHEDWESNGFYLYELNPENKPSLASRMISAAEKFCPVDRAEVIEGRDASGGIIRPTLDPRLRPQWPEAFWLLRNNTRLSYTLEAPSDFEMAARVKALTAAVQAALVPQTS